LPDDVIARAKQMLEILEGEELARGPRTADRGPRAGVPDGDQLTLFGPPLPDPVVERLKSLDPNATTPLQALTLLSELVEQVRSR
jgi:DNA mismatch repair protein MutS